MDAMHQVEMGAHVRILATPETDAAGYANWIGDGYGSTARSQTGVQVIAQDGEDDALNVGFDDGTTARLSRSVIEFVDVGDR